MVSFGWSGCSRIYHLAQTGFDCMVVLLEQEASQVLGLEAYIHPPNHSPHVSELDRTETPCLQIVKNSLDLPNDYNVEMIFKCCAE